MGFRLAPTSVTSNDLERRNSSCWHFAVISPNSIALEAYYVTVVEDIYCL